MKKSIIIIFLSVILSYSVVSQTNEPTITQISVNETGGISLAWEPNTSADDFDHSEVWYQQEYTTGFNKIPDSESPYPNSYYFDFSNAQANSRKTDYYVINYNSAQIPFTSETVSTIYLTSCYTGERIQLTWNRINELWTSRAFYIYRKTSTSIDWEFVDSTFNTTFQDAPMPGFKNYTYRVSYKNRTESSASMSNITNPISYSNHQPISPSITTVYVDDAGHIVLEWEKSPSINVVDYIIYQIKETGGWNEIDRAGSPDILTWPDKRYLPENCTETFTYAVAAIDACMEIGPYYPDSSKTTLLFNTPEYLICDKAVALTWNPYQSMPVDYYEILVSTGTEESFIPYAKVAGDVTSYSYTNLTESQYCFKIRAVHERGSGIRSQTVTSCSFCVDIQYPKEPTPGFFRYVSVVDNRVEVCFNVDTLATLSKYQVLRSETGEDGTYKVIATIDLINSSTACIVDSDPALKTQSISYHYLLNTLDSCDHVFPSEKHAQSILLQAVEDENHHAVLDWNEYDGYLSGLDSYIIHRYINNEFDRSFFINTQSLSYTDTDLQLADQTKSFSYRVAAISNLAYYITEPDTSFSNIATLKRLKSDIWFPNAFSPSGSNKIFRPIYAGIEVETYELTIFDRYGAAIYFTKEFGGGWDGKINGRIAASGGYGYMLKIKAKNGDRIERRGSMILVN